MKLLSDLVFLTL